MVASSRTVLLDEGTNAALEELARARGVTVEELLERLARSAALYEVEFLRGVNEGIADADAKRFVTPDEVKAAVRTALRRDGK